MNAPFRLQRPPVVEEGSPFLGIMVALPVSGVLWLGIYGLVRLAGSLL